MNFMVTIASRYTFEGFDVTLSSSLIDVVQKSRSTIQQRWKHEYKLVAAAAVSETSSTSSNIPAEM